MEEQKKELGEQVLTIRRVSRKTPGGNAVSFSALVAVGNRKGSFGLGLASAAEVPIAINKAIRLAKKKMIKLELAGTTIPYDIEVKFKAAKILLKPAPVGTGLKAGSVLRQIMNLAGITDVSAKIYGSNNKINLSFAMYRAFERMQRGI